MPRRRPHPAHRFEAFLKLDTGTHTGCIRQLAFTADGRRLVSAGECTLRVWDAQANTLERLLLGQASERNEEMFGNGNVVQFALTPDSRHVLVLKDWDLPPRAQPEGGRFTELQVFELDTGNLRSRFTLPGEVLSIDLSLDGRWLSLAGVERVRRQRQAWLGVYAAPALVRAGFPAQAPAPAARAVLGRGPAAVELAVAARWVPVRARRGQALPLVVALGGAHDGLLRWFDFSPGTGLRLQREAAELGPLEPATLALSAAHAVVGRADLPRQGRRRAGQLRWFTHDDAALCGTLRTDTLPVSTAFSPGGCHLAVGLGTWAAPGLVPLAGQETVAVHLYAATGVGFQLQSSYFGHDADVEAVCVDREGGVVSAGGDQHAIHRWDGRHRVGRLTAALRGLGQSFFAPGVNRREQVLFGTVPLRQLPPRQAARQQCFDLRTLRLHTTAESEPTARDFETEKWFVFDSGAQVIGLRHSPDAYGAELDQAPDLSLFVGRNDEWVIWTRSGYYAASPEGEALMGYHVNRGPTQEALFLTADRFKGFYRPDLVRAVVRHGSEARARAAGVRIPRLNVAQQLPPHLEWRGIAQREHTLQLRVSASWADPAGAPTRCWLLRNKRFVAAIDGTQAEYRFELRLLPGPNELTVLAENAQSRAVPLQHRIEGPAGPALLREQALDAPGKLFLLAAGVSDFLVAGTPQAQGHVVLPYPHRDAIALHNALAANVRSARRLSKPRLRNRAFEGVEATLLVNEEATKAALLRELDRLCDQILLRARDGAAERDVLVVFLAGHGVRFAGEPELYFWCHDLVPKTMEQTGLSLVDLGERLGSVPAEVVLIMDTCHSAMAGNNLMRAFTAEEIARRVQGVSERGMYVISAARSEEKARDSHADTQGVFTSALLAAWDAERAQAGEVRMLAWMTRTQLLLPQVMHRAGTDLQTPVLRMYGDLLPLTLYKA